MFIRNLPLRSHHPGTAHTSGASLTSCQEFKSSFATSGTMSWKGQHDLQGSKQLIHQLGMQFAFANLVFPTKLPTPSRPPFPSSAFVSSSKDSSSQHVSSSKKDCWLKLPQDVLCVPWFRKPKTNLQHPEALGEFQILQVPQNCHGWKQSFVAMQFAEILLMLAQMQATSSARTRQFGRPNSQLQNSNGRYT